MTVAGIQPSFIKLHIILGYFDGKKYGLEILLQEIKFYTSTTIFFV